MDRTFSKQYRNAFVNFVNAADSYAKIQYDTSRCVIVTQCMKKGSFDLTAVTAQERKAYVKAERTLRRYGFTAGAESLQAAVKNMQKQLKASKKLASKKFIALKEAMSKYYGEEMSEKLYSFRFGDDVTVGDNLDELYRRLTIPYLEDSEATARREFYLTRLRKKAAETEEDLSPLELEDSFQFYTQSLIMALDEMFADETSD